MAVLGLRLLSLQQKSSHLWQSADTAEISFVKRFSRLGRRVELDLWLVIVAAIKMAVITIN